MIRLEDRQSMVQDIAAAQVAGARLRLACALAGITVRTLQRWRSLRCGPAWTKAMRRPMYSRAAVRKWLQGQEQQPIRSRGPMRNSK